jgi:hypothetical protein
MRRDGGRAYVRGTRMAGDDRLAERHAGRVLRAGRAGWAGHAGAEAAGVPAVDGGQEGNGRRCRMSGGLSDEQKLRV